MKLFDFFRKKKEPEVEEEPGGVLPNGVPISSRLAAYLPQLEAAALPFVQIKAQPSDSLFLFDSKFGGLPYWPAGKPYPTDADSNYMYLLAQLNFAQMPHLDGYPQKGILQFYVAADDVYGLNFDEPTVQKNFRIVYFEDINDTALEDFSFLEGQEQESALPVERQMQLTFSLQQDYFAYSDIRYPEDLSDELQSEEKPAGAKQSLADEVYKVFPEGGHKMGGYAYFTQYDPRDEKAEYLEMVLLLQIDSQDNDILWGDVGVGNFFIHPADLERKDFSRVLYNWDCT